MRNRAIATLASLLLPLAADARPVNLGDYPLRLAVYGRKARVHRFKGFQSNVTGTGRGNLYEGGSAHGVDFAYDCSGTFMESSGPETYPARWTRPGDQVEIVVGSLRNPDKVWTCKMSVQEKDFAYERLGNRRMKAVATGDYDAQMKRRGYDPESGRDVPQPRNSPPPPPPQ